MHIEHIRKYYKPKGWPEVASNDPNSVYRMAFFQFAEILALRWLAVVPLEELANHLYRRCFSQAIGTHPQCMNK